MFLYYVDDAIILVKEDRVADTIIKDLQDTKKAKNEFVVEDCGNLGDYLGINVDKLANGNIKLSQPHLINSIIQDVQLPDKSKNKKIPAPSTHILQRDGDGQDFDSTRFNYRSVIGKLNFLEKGTRPDIAYATHQLARFSSDPKESHGDAAIWLVKYLRETRDQGLILTPNAQQEFEVYADADFVGNWHPSTASLDIGTAKSRSGWIITYCGIPLTWCSKLQTQIALSTCEAEYYSLSQALREAIPTMGLVKEFKEYRFLDSINSPRCIARSLKTMPVRLKWPRSTKCDLSPSI